MTLERVIVLAAETVSVVCTVLLFVLIGFDAQAERFTAGLTPAQFSRSLETDLLDDYSGVLGVAHNAGDDVRATLAAGAHGVDAIEIDVTTVGGELHASHDAPVPIVDTLFFRGPELEEAWEAASLRDTVVLHLKESGSAYLEKVRRFLAERRGEARVIFQTGNLASLRVLRRTVPSAERLLLVFDEDDLRRVHGDDGLQEVVDGVSVRERLLTAPEHRRLEQRGLTTFAWTVNEGERMNELVQQGLDGLITDRLDIMSLLGDEEAPR